MEQQHKKHEKIRILLFIALTGGIALSFLKPVAQDPNYHFFADNSQLHAVPNFRNVVSNIPFLFIGAFAIFYLFMATENKINKALRVNYFIFFSGIFFTGIGSAYYHLHPDNSTLLWDRLPMTVSFMSFFSIIIGEFIGTKRTALLLFTFITIGIASVVYWQFTEANQQGDLRLYAAVQFLPMILIPLILLMFKSTTYKPPYIWLMLLVYALSKVCETFDAALFHSFKYISGHSIKHLLAAMSPLLLLIAIHISAKNRAKE